MQHLRRVFDKKELERCYNLYGFISKYVIDLECDFTYQAISTYFNKEELFELFGNNYRSYGNMSSGMIIITKMLDEKNIKYQLEKTWDWLVNDKTNKHMFVDIYIESLNLVIEFDGNQHFRYSKHFHKNKQKYLRKFLILPEMFFCSFFVLCKPIIFQRLFYLATSAY